MAFMVIPGPSLAGDSMSPFLTTSLSGISSIDA